MKATDFVFFNWFDLVVVALLVVGIFVGRKRGMSLELLSLLQWLMIVFVAAMVCNPLGSMLADISGISPVLSYITAYLMAAVVIKILFMVIRRMAGEKLVASDVFGNFEYYLGMIAGMVRFACIILFVMALLNARQVGKAELDAQLRSQREWAGSIYFPPYGVIQRSVFSDSITGRAVKQYLSAQLINVDSSAGGGAHRENIGQIRAHEVDDIIKGK
jgi:uncharacterized membrane protein required for colicin V production